MIFRNELKPDTPKAMRDLQQGDITPIIITGDNANCAQYIARACSIIKPRQRVILGQLEGEQVSWRYFGEGVENSEIMTSREVLRKCNSTRKNLSNEHDFVLALTGNATLNALVERGYLELMIFQIRVYARMSPGILLILYSI
jgi:magnesium-transporting ATPase (P-type)